MTKISVVIPTRNRAHLLQYALQSALAQDYDDFEVIVSNNGSTDSTREVVASLESRRLRYVETPRPLDMPDHWEWVLSQVNGQYFFFLCDDDAVAPAFLPRVAQVIEDTGAAVVTCAAATYTHPTWPVSSDRNVLRLGISTGRTVRCSSERVLAEAFANLRYWCTPRANNSLTSRELATRVQNTTGRFFHAPSPDFTSCWLVLASTPEYYYIDEPLLIFGLAAESIGSSTALRRDGATLAYRSELAQEVFQLSPLKTYTIANNIAETLLVARAALPAHLGCRQVDHAALYLSCREDLERLESNGVAVGEELGELEAFLRGEPARTKLAVRRRLMLARLGESPVGPWLRRLRTFLLGPPPVDVDHSGLSSEYRGESEGFTDVFQCTQHVERLATLSRSSPLPLSVRP